MFDTGDLIKHRNSQTVHQIKHVRPDGRLIVQNLKTRLVKLITRPECYDKYEQQQQETDK